MQFCDSKPARKDKTKSVRRGATACEFVVVRSAADQENVQTGVVNSSHRGMVRVSAEIRNDFRRQQLYEGEPPFALVPLYLAPDNAKALFRMAFRGARFRPSVQHFICFGHLARRRRCVACRGTLQQRIGPHGGNDDDKEPPQHVSVAHQCGGGKASAGALRRW